MYITASSPLNSDSEVLELKPGGCVHFGSVPLGILVQGALGNQLMI